VRGEPALPKTTFEDAMVELMASRIANERSNAILEVQPIHQQPGATAWTYALATTIIVAIARIYGRRFPCYGDVLNDLTQRFGSKPIGDVIDEAVRPYKLRVQALKDDQAAIKALAANRPPIAVFQLDAGQWTEFAKFYRDKPKGVLTELPAKTGTVIEHAVVLVDTGPKDLTFLNSWGEEWADRGRFRVSGAAIVDARFHDVFWTLQDLGSEDIRAWEALKARCRGDITRTKVKYPA
jgi:hypothetical protein